MEIEKDDFFEDVRNLAEEIKEKEKQDGKHQNSNNRESQR